MTMQQPRTDLVTVATLVAENATLAAENANLRGMVDMLADALRDLPPGDYPKRVQALWQIVQNHPQETCGQ